MREYSANNPTPPVEIRSDASANRKAIIAAARDLFSVRGPEIPLSEVAKAAKVSRPTLYRNFSDRSDLIAAVFHLNLDFLEEFSEKHQEDENLFSRLMELILRQQVEFHSLIPYLSEGHEILNHRLWKIFDAPARVAKARGVLRADFNIERDLNLLIMMLGGALLHPSDQNDQAKVQRALQLLTEGIQGNR